MQIMELSNIDVFFSQEELIFYQEYCKTFFFIYLAEKSEGKETSKFWPKSWSYPFPKNANFSTSNCQPIWRVKVFSIKNIAKYCCDQFGLEKQDEETSNLWPKLLAKNGNYATF